MTGKRLWVARVEVEMIVAATTEAEAEHVAMWNAGEEIRNRSGDVDVRPLEASGDALLLSAHDDEACPYGDTSRTLGEYLKGGGA